MISNKEEARNDQDNNRNDFDNTTNSFASQNEDAFISNELDDDELKEDEGGSDNDLEPTFDQDDLNDEDEGGSDNDLEPTFDQDDLNDEDEDGNHPDELPEKHESENEGSGYHTQQREVNQPQKGADTSYSEQNDVTPPNKKEFPSTGPAKTDFESRPQGRTTGRMLGHEPGTEGI